MGGMEFDSDESREDEEGNLLAMSLRPIVEGVMTVVLDARMEVKEVRGLAGLIPEGGKSLITEESIISTVTPVPRCGASRASAGGGGVDLGGEREAAGRGAEADLDEEAGARLGGRGDALHEG